MLNMPAEMPVPAEYKLPVDRFKPSPAVADQVAPDFVIGDVGYYKQLPTPPTERKPQVLLPWEMVGPWATNFVANWNATSPPDKQKRIGWQADANGIRDNNYGAITHHATVEY